MAFSPVKTAKRIGIGLEAFVDGASSHFTSVGKLLLGTSLGGVLGGAIGLGTMFLTGNNALGDFIEEKARYEALELSVKFPDQCDFDNSFYFALKGPDKKYGLYGGTNRHYEPLDKSEAVDFVDRYEDCMQALRVLPKLQQDMKLYRNFVVSQPLRRIDTNSDDADGVVNWRREIELSNSNSIKLSDTQEELGADVDAVSAFEKTWAAAISDFKDGEIYDHAGDKNVTTFEYQDSYKSYSFGYVKYGAIGFGLLFGLGCGFFRDPSEDYKERGQARDARRAALAHDNIKF
jgi:hypothetical protein